MSNRISWAPSPESDVASYILERAVSASGPWTTLVSIVNDLQGPNYDVLNAVFFYVDSDGTTGNWYHLIAVDNAGLRSQPSAPFQPATTTTPTLDAQVRLDHNYPQPDALRYVLASGAGIGGATIRLFLQENFQPNGTAAVGISQTNSEGRWVDPVFVTPGYTYVVQFHKEGVYGPDHTSVIV